MICSESFNYICVCLRYYFSLLTITISRIKRIIPKIISPNIIYLSFCYGFYYDLNAFYYENLNFCFFKKRCFVGLYRPRFLLKTASEWENLRFVKLQREPSGGTPSVGLGVQIPLSAPKQKSSKQAIITENGLFAGFFVLHLFNTN